MTDVLPCRRTWCNACQRWGDCRHDVAQRVMVQRKVVGAMPKGGKVDRAIQAVEATGKAKGSAIAILKSHGVIHQTGRHLAPGKPGKKKR